MFHYKNPLKSTENTHTVVVVKIKSMIIILLTMLQLLIVLQMVLQCIEIS